MTSTATASPAPATSEDRTKKPIGFDNQKYLAEQSAAILHRAERFGGKLYLEFGGKLLFDYHAARVLPGFDPNVKMTLLQRLKNDANILVCIYAGDIARKKLRADFGITYDVDAFKLIDDLGEWGLTVQAVIVTRFEAEVEPSHRSVVLPARRAAEEAKKTGKGNKGVYAGAALELPSGKIATGKNSPLMHATSSLIFNAIKELAGIPDQIPLLPPSILESIRTLKADVLGSKSVSMNLEEALIALSISAAANPLA